MSTAPKKAMTSAEKMRELRIRAAEAVNGTERQIADLPDSALLEAVRIAYRGAKTFTLAEITIEMMKRANKRVSPNQRMLVATIDETMLNDRRTDWVLPESGHSNRRTAR